MRAAIAVLSVVSFEFYVTTDSTYIAGINYKKNKNYSE
jgi:hypothetical protein